MSDHDLYVQEMAYEARARSPQDGICIFLCDETGIAAEPWAEAGYECYCVDLEHSIRRPRREGNIHFVWGDCRTWRPPEGRRIVFMAGFPPCTHDAVSGNRDHLIKGAMMLRDSLETFETCRLAIAYSAAPGYVEHPITILASIPHIGKPGHYFHPHQYTRFCRDDHYTKNTGIWPFNGFVMPPEAKDETILTKPDNRIHYMGAAGQKERSASPRGFNRAVFEANRPEPHAPRCTCIYGPEVSFETLQMQGMQCPKHSPMYGITTP